MTAFSTTYSSRDVALIHSGRTADLDECSYAGPSIGLDREGKSCGRDWPGSIQVEHSGLNGTRHEMFCGQLFEKIIVVPRMRSVGFVLSNISFDIEVWNTHANEAKPFSGVSIAGSGGLLVSGGITAGNVFGPMQSTIYTGVLGADGDATVANVATFVFSGESGTDLTVLGTRLTVFSVEIDWSDGFEESIEYKTAILASPFSANEQRIQMRRFPRYSASFRAITTNARETAHLDSVVSSWQNRVFCVPWWMDASMLTADAAAGASTISVDTTNRTGFEDGGLVMLFKDQFTWEAVTAQTVTSGAISLTTNLMKTWAAGTVVIPMKRCRMAEAFPVQRETCEIATVKASFSCEVVG